MKRTSEPRARWSRWSRVAAALAGLAVAAGPLLAVPAHAQPSAIGVSFAPNPAQITVGQAGTSVTVTLTNTGNRRSDPVQASVSLTGVENHADYTVNQGSCQSVQGNSVSCGHLEPRATVTFTVDVSPRGNSDLAQGQTANGNLAVTIGGTNNGSGTGTVTVIGGSQTAPNISGTVTDLKSSDPVEGVKVTAKDSKGANFEGTTGADGKFNIQGPIAAGAVEITFSKDGYTEETDSLTATAGQPLIADFRMTAEKAEESPSASEEPSTEVAAPEEESDGFGSLWVLIILGALLVIGGTVAIVMLVRKGKKDGDDDDLPPLPDVPSMHQPTATQTGRLGVYDAAPRRPGMDAPTMIHNGPLINDGDLARYGQEPGTGFGPSYDDRGPGAGRDDATRMYPSSGAGTGAGRDDATRMYPTSGAGGGYPTSGAPTSGPGYPTSGAGGGYPTSGAPSSGGGYQGAPGGGYPTSGAPTSGPGGGYPTSGAPSSGGGYQGAPGGGYPSSNAPSSGYPNSGLGGGYPTSGAPAGGGGGYPGASGDTPSWRDRGRDAAPGGGDQRHSDNWGRGTEEPRTRGGSGDQDDWGRFGARDQQEQQGWGGRPAGGADWGSRQDGQGGQGNWGGQQPDDRQRGDDRQPRQRRYSDDDYDDRPQSW